MRDNASLRSIWPRVILDAASSIYNFRHWASLSSRVKPPVYVHEDYFGINIATSSNETYDQYLFERLNELGINHVRMDFTSESFDANAERLLTRVLAEDYRVLLNIFPLFDDAKKIGKDRTVEQSWYGFVEAVFSKYGASNIIFEIGNTTKPWQVVRFQLSGLP